MRAESLCATDVAVGTHIDDGFLVGVDSQPPQAQCAVSSEDAVCFMGHDEPSSASSRYAGTRQRHPSSSSTRCRKASDASGSPWVMKVVLGGVLHVRSQPMISSASACAESMSRLTTSARIGTYPPWILTSD